MSALSTHFDRYHSKDDKLPVCTIGAAKKQINSPKAYALGELLVRVTGVEPARRAAPDPKGDVTSVKDFSAGTTSCICAQFHWVLRLRNKGNSYKRLRPDLRLLLQAV